MYFTPRLEPKKGNKRSWNNPDFSHDSSCGKLAEGVFSGVSVEVFGENVKNVLQNGDYGKGSESRGAPNNAVESNAEEFLTLNLEEAFFLSYYLGALNILDLDGKRLEFSEMLREVQMVNSKFLENLASYIYLKSKGWIVRSGIKFGVNFCPQFFHASFGVTILTPASSNCLKAHDMKGLQRIAETSDKDLLVLELTKPSDFKMNSLEDISKFRVSEIIIKRFNQSMYIQS